MTNAAKTTKAFAYLRTSSATNIGEDLKPLVKVASGGEISRIMLALKNILSKRKFEKL